MATPVVPNQFGPRNRGVSQGPTGTLSTKMHDKGGPHCPGQAPGDVRPAHAEDQCRLRHLGRADVRRGMEQALRHPALRTEWPSWKRNGQYRHGERTKAAITERRRFSALLKMLRAGGMNT